MNAPLLEPSGLEVTDVHWERIQLVLRIRRRQDIGAQLDAGDVHLRPANGHQPTLASRPVVGAIGPDERLVRFNVFAGHDQMPLAQGTWQVVLRRPGATREWTAIPGSVELKLKEPMREFISGGATYRVNLAADDGAPLDVTISTEAPDRPSLRSPRTLIAWLRALPRQAWFHLFGLLLTIVHGLPFRRPLIVFTSDSRTSLSGNLKFVHDRIIERGLDRQFRLATIFKASIRLRRPLRDRARFVWLLARAHVILVEDYQPAIYRLPRRSDQRIIQLWHAWGAFKTVGYSRIGKSWGPNPYSSVHKNYTYATVSSTHEVPFYAEAFGIPDEHVVPTGTPRMDDFLDPSRQAERREAAYTAIPGTRDREVILFAPTFRGGSARRARYPVDLIDLDAANALCVERNATLIFKMHPFVRRRVDIPDEYRDRLIDVSDLPVETNDLLLITDLLITDYSSIVFEYSTQGRPMLFYAFDLEEYIATRDFYVPFEDFVPGRIVRTFDELVDAIRREDYQLEKVAPFAARHLPAGNGTATDRIIDELILS